MKFGKVAKQSIKEIFTNRFKIVAILGVVGISVAFGILYVMAFWDPPGNIKNVDIAIVNLDKGATRDGEKVQYGNDVADEAKKNDEASWTVVDADTFDNGIENTDYYMAFVIPENFSQSVISATDAKPEKANIIYLCNQRKNFLLSQYGENIKTKFSDMVSASITKEYTQAAWDSLYDVSTGMSDAADGSKKISDGVNELSSKVPTLADGIGAAADGANALKSGLGELNSNIPKLADGASQLSTGIDKIVDEVPALVTGVSKLKTGSENLAGGLSKLSSSVQQSGSSVDSSINQIIALIQNGQYDTAIGGLQKLQSTYNAGQSALVSSVGQLESGAAELKNGISQVANNAPALSGGMAKLQTGANSLASGAAAAETGVSKLYKGSVSLSSGMTQLNNAVPTLEKGVYALKDGTNTLSTALNDGSVELKEGLVNSSSDMANFVSDPEETTSETYGELPSYGPGFSPLFLSLALWIGALLAFFVIDSRPPISLKANTFETVFGKIFVFWIVGIIEAILCVTMSLVIGVPTTSTLAFILFACFVSLVFILILQNLQLIFGDLIGKAVAIFFVILQLTSCGGTFPKELLPNFFRTINPYMPFTYSVDGFREIISGGDISMVLKDAVILGLIGLLFLTFSLIFNHPAEVLSKKARIRMKKEKRARASKEENDANVETISATDDTVSIADDSSYESEFESEGEGDDDEEDTPKRKRFGRRNRRNRQRDLEEEFE